MATCSVSGCPAKARAKGMCGKHYMRVRSHGDPSVCLVERGRQQRWVDRETVSASKDDCLTWPFERTWKGYGRMRVDGKRKAAHRYVCEIFHGEPPSPRHVAAHSCGKGHEGCVNPHHLRWATTKENHADRKHHGTLPRGEANGNAKLVYADVLAIKGLLNTTTQKEIAQKFGVSRGAIRDIKTKRSWAWVEAT